MRVTVALGGHALLQRGQPLTAANQRDNARAVCAALAPVAREHELAVAHGRGPNVGLLAVQSIAYTAVETYPLDVLGAQTEGMVGYLLAQELGNALAPGHPTAAVLTRAEVDPDDPAFDHPTKPVGPAYTEAEAVALVRRKGWAFGADGTRLRPLVPAPAPRRVLGTDPVRWLLDRGCVVVCAGGGSVPVMAVADGDGDGAGRRLAGVEAVIDEDAAAALLAVAVRADVLVIATDVDAVYRGWGGRRPRAIGHTTPALLAREEFAAASMGPKVRAACAFVQQTGGVAAIGAIEDVEGLVRGTAGTIIAPDAPPDPPPPARRAAAQRA